MVTSALAVILAAGPVEQPAIKLAATELTPVNVDPKLATFFTEHLAQEMSVRGIRVVTPKDVATLLGLERQRELIGCGEQSAACIAELGNALGADGVVLGDVARTGSAIRVNVKVLSPVDVRVLASFGATADSEDQVVVVLKRAAHALVPAIAKSLGRPVPAAFATQTVEDVSAAAPASPLRKFAWAPAVAGAVLAGAGAFLVADAGAQYSALTLRGRPGSLSDDEAAAMRARGENNQMLGWTGVGLGAAAFAGAAAMYLLGSPASVAVIPSPGAAHVSLAVELP